MEIEPYEIGKVENENQGIYLDQLIHRMALCCECCLLEGNQYQGADCIMNGKVKVDENDPAKSITSRVTLCKKHFEKIQQINGQQQYHYNTGVNMENFQENNFKTAKQIKQPNLNLLDQSIQETSTFFCCRILRQRYINIIKVIQLLESYSFEASKKAVVEQKKTVLKQTEEKFKQYLSKKNTLSMRQKFLMMKWYQRMEKKAGQPIQLHAVDQNAEQSAIIASKTIYLDES